MKVEAILIDDERKSLAILKNKLERLCPNVLIIGETRSPQDGLSMIHDLKPQLLFLDVAMPLMSGFDLLAKIDNPSFEIIFATAFDHYAVDAIKQCAIGYLVKPIDNDDLVIAVNKAIQNIEDKTALIKNRLLIENLDVQSFQNKKIVIPTQEGLQFIKVNEITHCEGVDGYTKLHVRDGKPMLCSRSIGHFNKILQSKSFYRVHKSYLINLDHIEKYLNEGYVVLTNNHTIDVSRNRRKEFLNRLKDK